MHALEGQWEIVADSPVGKLEMLATMHVAENEQTFQGEVFVKSMNKTVPLENGTINGNEINYEVAMKFGLIPMRFKLQGTFNTEDWTCQGVARALKMECAYTGKKVL